MKNDPFHNKNPFTTPEDYFDVLQGQIMARIQKDEHLPADCRRMVRMRFYRTLVAAAACVVFIFAAAVLYRTHSVQSTAVVEPGVEDDTFYQWFYASDKTTLLAETLDVNMPESLVTNDEYASAEDEEIIRFLERENINIVAIVHSMNQNVFY